MDRFEIITCGCCGGSGVIPRATWVYEAGCGFGHASSDEDRCEECNGAGEFINEYELVAHVALVEQAAE